jgi:hypothetical protein
VDFSRDEAGRSLDKFPDLRSEPVHLRWAYLAVSGPGFPGHTQGLVDNLFQPLGFERVFQLLLLCDASRRGAQDLLALGIRPFVGKDTSTYKPAHIVCAPPRVWEEIDVHLRYYN